MVLSLAPAMLTLFGRAVWWLPGWLSRLLPHVDIEGETAPTPAPAVQPRPSGAAAAAAPPDGDVPASRPPGGLGIPGSEPWPEPPTTVHETTGPGDGSVRGDPRPDA